MIHAIVALLIVLGGLLMPATARADLLLLVHGYLGSAASWEQGGVVPVLTTHGWERAGILRAGPGGVQEIPAPGRMAKNRIYLAELPSIAPVSVQADHLVPVLRLLAARHPRERLILVGHSVGGVVLRLALVRGDVSNPAALITIASPHLGTPLAEQALDATDDWGPVEVIKDFFGGGGYQTLKVSRGLYLDIVRQHPGSLLFWLNHQPHPDIRYVSLVRGGPMVMGDILVPGISQDMNNIPALRGRRVSSRLAGQGHELVWPDGHMLAAVIQELAP
ncbi:MAG: hypothetical protein HQL98_06540 [Magnetococcales bacterium]|nr:hypothetical protein [Magnetococcales bacterium]